MPLLGVGYVKWHIPIPYTPPFKMSFTPIKGAGHGPLCPLAVPVTVVQASTVKGGKARERGGCGRGVPHGREIFENLVYEKWHSVAH